MKEIDYSERSGFMSGKALALADWSHRKESASYEKLFQRLRARNWARAERKNHPERARARLKFWRDRNREHVRALDRSGKRRRREVALKAAGFRVRCLAGVPVKVLELVCEACGTRMEKDRPSRFCTRKCRNHFHGAARARARNRGIRQMDIMPTILDMIAKEPGLTTRQIVDRAPHLKFGSVATLVSTLLKSGALERIGVARKNARLRCALGTP